MLCFRYKRLLVPYAEGSLDQRTASKVESHLASCEKCRAELECVKSVSDALRTSDVPAAEPSPDLWAKVKHQIETEPATAPLRRPSRVPQVAYAFAAVVFVGVLGWSLTRTPITTEEMRTVTKAPSVSQSAAPKSAAESIQKRASKANASPSITAVRPVTPPVQQAKVPRANKPAVSADGHAAQAVPAKPAPPVIMAAIPREDSVSPKQSESTDRLSVAKPAEPSSELASATVPTVPRDFTPTPEREKQDGQFFDKNAEGDARESKTAVRVGHAHASHAKSSAAMGCALSGDKPLSADEYLKLGNSQMGVGQKTEAAANFYNALANSKPEKWHVIANEVKQSGALNLVTANAEKSFAANQDTNSGLVLYELQAVQQNQTGMLNTAQQLVNLDPKSPLSWLKLGEAYESAGDKAKALEAYKKAAAGSDPNVASIAKAKAKKLRKSTAAGQE